MQRSPPGSEKVTVPVGVPPSSAVTVAESVTSWPTTAGLGDEDGVDVSVVSSGCAPAGVEDSASATGVSAIPAITARATPPFTSRGTRARRASDFTTVCSSRQVRPHAGSAAFYLAPAMWREVRRRDSSGGRGDVTDTLPWPCGCHARVDFGRAPDPRTATHRLRGPHTAHGRWQRGSVPGENHFEHRAETGQHQRERDDDGHHLEDGTAHRLPVTEVVELVE